MQLNDELKNVVVHGYEDWVPTFEQLIDLLNIFTVDNETCVMSIDETEMTVTDWQKYFETHCLVITKGSVIL